MENASRSHQGTPCLLLGEEPQLVPGHWGGWGAIPHTTGRSSLDTHLQHHLPPEA